MVIKPEVAKSELRKPKHEKLKKSDPNYFWILGSDEVSILHIKIKG